MRHMARKIVEGMIQDNPALGKLAKASAFVGAALLAPARKIARTEYPEQPALLEYLLGGRKPEVLF